MTGSEMLRAYGAAGEARDPRAREADVFRRVIGSLRASLEATPVARVRAIADNRRLWLSVEAALIHPANQLPMETRALMISLARSVQREMSSSRPDIDFLIAVNEQVAEGLSQS